MFPNIEKNDKNGWNDPDISKVYFLNECLYLQSRFFCKDNNACGEEMDFFIKNKYRECTHNPYSYFNENFIERGIIQEIK